MTINFNFARKVNDLIYLLKSIQIKASYHPFIDYCWNICKCKLKSSDIQEKSGTLCIKSECDIK